MPYNELLAERIRRALAGYEGVTEKKMFGGVTFMSLGRMLCGVVRDDLMVRVGPDRYEEALSLPGVRPMDFTHRPMKGMVFVSPSACAGDDALQWWVALGLEFVNSLPTKE